MGKLSPSLAGHLAMLTFSALVAGSFSLGAMVANDIAPMALNALRFWIGAGIVGGMVWWTGTFKASDYKGTWRYLLLGGIFAFYFVLMFEGLKTAEPVSASAVFTLTPIISAIAGYILLRQMMTARIALALAIGGAGALWVIFRADWEAFLRFQIGKGEFIYFWGCVAHAIYTPLVRKLNRGEPAVVFTFGVVVAAAVVLTFFGASAIGATDWSSLPPLVWVTILYTSIFATAATAVLLQFASLRLPAAKVMAYTYLAPTWVLGWELALGQSVPPLAIIGGIGLTILALLLLLRD